MALSIRLSKIGRKGIRAYRIVVAETRSKRDGKAVETLGSYNPSLKPPLIKIDKKRLKYWQSVGAKPTEAVRELIKPKTRDKKPKTPARLEAAASAANRARQT